MARQLQYKHFIYLDDPATGRLIQFADEEVRGDADLWQALLDCVRRFQKLGMPRREQYTFAIKNGQQIMQLGELQWVIV